MNVLFWIFRLAASLISLYTFLIFVRVMLTWIPSLAYSKIGRLLADICDPFLNLFRRVKFLRTSAIDFTPILAIGTLVIASTVLQNFAAMGRVSLGAFIAIVFQICWSLVNSFLTIVSVIIVIRLLFNIFSKDSGSRIWAQLDSLISPIAYKVTGFFFPRKFIQYRTVLIIALVALVLVQLIMYVVMGVIIGFFGNLPF